TSNPVNPGEPIVGGSGDVIIQLNETPTDTTVDNGDSVVDFEISTPNGNITNVSCTLNNVAVDCNEVSRIPISNPGVGDHEFRIVAENDQGDSETEVIRWTIYNAVTDKSKDIAVTVTGDSVDIIINVDNSGSMEYEQQSMANRISSLMSKFSHLDYHIAITTTSPAGGVWLSSLDYVDGKFIQLSDGSYCIRKDVHTEAQAQNFIQQTVVRPLFLTNSQGQTILDEQGVAYPEGNGWERGIFTTYRAFERAQDSGSPESGCLRQNVPKHVILISDEDETTTNNDGVPLNQASKSNGDNLRNYVASRYNNTLFKFHSIIVNPYSPEGQTCLAIHGWRPGLAYAELSLDTGGVIGSVCANDYASQLGEVGQTISDSNLSYPLDCVAVVSNGSMGRVIDIATGNEVTVGYSFNGDKVEFDSLLPQGNYRVTYSCLE
ncbi:MAG: hypothetical protein HRT44_13235, partial [Bdellovibrionales bacterium]|nr:hypothetical protein [Bdellovibrionales bacterium]NQZ20201.1 hypothetical protein [Bdellovibrionales bacterium]